MLEEAEATYARLLDDWKRGTATPHELDAARHRVERILRSEQPTMRGNCEHPTKYLKRSWDLSWVRCKRCGEVLTDPKHRS